VRASTMSGGRRSPASEAGDPAVAAAIASATAARILPAATQNADLAATTEYPS
jgi:hypothetical protein